MIGDIQMEKHGEGVFGNSYLPVHGHLKKIRISLFSGINKLALYFTATCRTMEVHIFHFYSAVERGILN